MNQSGETVNDRASTKNESTVEGNLPPETLAAIMAAAAIATQKRVRVTRVRYRQGPSEMGLGWKLVYRL